jgi:farnesyl diphosphate synthase
MNAEPRNPQSMVEPALAEAAAFVERSLDGLLPQPNGPEARLLEAMRYAALGGGKRLRAFLVLQSGRLFGVDRGALGRVAAAVECVHAYSLVHDDLPAMDDDDMRRGKPSLHKAFDEATAILAGDALLTFAFALLASPDAHGDPFVRCELLTRLAQAAGHAGMVGGQMMDMAFEGGAPALHEITRMQRMKTAALFTFSCEAGAILGKASQPLRAALCTYGQELGLAFQISDDLLDEDGDATEMGKAAQKDAARGKRTVASVLGAERARAQATAMASQAIRHLDLFDEKADLLRAAADFVVARRA